MIRVAICDDSQVENNILKNLVGKLISERSLECQITQYECGEDLIAAYETIRYDLIFLDVMMKQMNGIDTGKIIRKKDMDTEIVYCTSSKDFVLDSYEVFSLGYLMKPFDSIKLSKIIEFFLYKKPKQATKVIEVRANAVTHYIYYKDIVYIESIDKIVVFHTINNGSIKVYDKLINVEERLGDRRFLRCHQSYILNLEYVIRMQENDFVTITNKIIPIRRNGRKEIKQIYQEYSGGVL